MPQDVAFYINKINDKGLGDFDSALWAQHGFDSVRADLLAYYQQQKDNLPNASLKDMKSLATKECKLRQSYPNNCYTFATGLIASGNRAFEPAFHAYVDLNNSEEQIVEIQKEEMKHASLETVLNSHSFTRAMKKSGFLTMRTANKKDLATHHPVITMLCPLEDYHFIQPHLIPTTNGPIVTFSEKMWLGGDVISHQTIDEFFYNFERSMHCTYQKPKLYLSNKDLFDRHVWTDKSHPEKVRVHLFAGNKQ